MVKCMRPNSNTCQMSSNTETLTVKTIFVIYNELCMFYLDVYLILRQTFSHTNAFLLLLHYMLTKAPFPCLRVRIRIACPVKTFRTSKIMFGLFLSTVSVSRFLSPV